MKMHLRFLTFLSFLIILFAARCAWAQIAPAAVAITQGGPGEHYLFRSQGASAPGGFLYVNYGTGELDAILVTVAPNGNFSGTSPATKAGVEVPLTEKAFREKSSPPPVARL